MENKIKSHWNAVEVKDLKIVFDEGDKNETKVLENVNLNIHKNKITYIIGATGTGKTALITHIAGLLKSKYGMINVDGFNISPKDKKIKNIKELRKKICMVFQFAEHQLFKNTILSDVVFGPINLGVKKNEAEKRAKKYITNVGLNDSFLSRSPFELSGGQKRRVAIAGILAIEPSIILFDEPCGGLDPQGEIDINKIIVNVKKNGGTAVVVTHDMNHVLEHGDEVVVLHNKKVYAIGTPYEIYTDKKLMSETKLQMPKIISLIYELIKKDKKYERLLLWEPKNVEQLTKFIILGGKYGKK